MSVFSSFLCIISVLIHQKDLLLNVGYLHLDEDEILPKVSGFLQSTVAGFEFTLPHGDCPGCTPSGF